MRERQCVREREKLRLLFIKKTNQSNAKERERRLEREDAERNSAIKEKKSCNKKRDYFNLYKIKALFKKILNIKKKQEKKILFRFRIFEQTKCIFYPSSPSSPHLWRSPSLHTQ